MADIKSNQPAGYPWNGIGFSSSKYFEIISCGNLRLDYNSHLYRPNGRRDYHLIYNVEGKCYLNIKGKSYVAEKGDVVLYRPDEPQDYQFKKSDNSHNYWVHFSGTTCESIFKENNLEDIYIVKLSHTSEIEYLLSKMCYYYHIGGFNRDTICNGLLIAVLGLVGQYNISASNKGPKYANNKNQQLISEVLSQFRLNDVIKMNITDCAKYCNMSETHFSRKFKEIMGVSPQQFMTNAKLERAQQLLFYTDKSISNIAIEVGYEDPNYFSRIFKKHFNVTPKEYRDSIAK